MRLEWKVSIEENLRGTKGDIKHGCKVWGDKLRN